MLSLFPLMRKKEQARTRMRREEGEKRGRVVPYGV